MLVTRSMPMPVSTCLLGNGLRLASASRLYCGVQHIRRSFVEWNQHIILLLPGTASEPEVGSAGAAAGGDSHGCMAESVSNISACQQPRSSATLSGCTAQGTSSEGKDDVPHLDEHDIPDLQHIGVVLVDQRRGVASANAIIVQLCSGEARRRMPLFYQFGRTSGGRGLSAPKDGDESFQRCNNVH